MITLYSPRGIRLENAVIDLHPSSIEVAKGGNIRFRSTRPDNTVVVHLTLEQRIRLTRLLNEHAEVTA